MIVMISGSSCAGGYGGGDCGSCGGNNCAVVLTLVIVVDGVAVVASMVTVVMVEVMMVIELMGAFVVVMVAVHVEMVVMEVVVVALMLKYPCFRDIMTPTYVSRTGNCFFFFKLTTDLEFCKIIDNRQHRAYIFICITGFHYYCIHFVVEI